VGHTVNSDREYRLLQQRLDRMVTGAPDSPVLMKILKLLYSPEEARLARGIPSRPTPLRSIALKLDVSENELADKLTAMAERGLVLDFERRGRRFVMLPPIVVGFFEFTFMRTREDVPMKELSHLFEEYMSADDRFARSVFAGQTQVGRALVYEESLPEGDHTEILDWERVSHIVRSASAVAVSLCSCRHKASHLGTVCEHELETCLTFGAAAESLSHRGIAKSITPDEAMEIVASCKEAGLAQVGDNVQRRVSYLCNCCGCCCEMMRAIRLYDVRNAIVTSNWVAGVDEAKCGGCGACVRACPIEAIALSEDDTSSQNETGRTGKFAIVDKTLCLGCGVCHSACNRDAITMNPRLQRVYTPEDVFDRVVTMAIERGKLADLLFENSERLTHRALGRMLSVLEKSPPFRAAMAVKPLRSAFLNTMLSGVRRTADAIGEESEKRGAHPR